MSATSEFWLKEPLLTRGLPIMPVAVDTTALQLAIERRCVVSDGGGGF